MVNQKNSIKNILYNLKLFLDKSRVYVLTIWSRNCNSIESILYKKSNITTKNEYLTFWIFEIAGLG